METDSVGHKEETEIVNNEAAVNITEDPAYLEYLAEPLPQAAGAETTLVKKTKTVRGKSSQTLLDTKRFTDPINMTDDELGDMVVGGYRQFYRYIPWVITLWQRFQKKERDSKNHLLEPIKGCHSFDEFCTKILDRTPSAVYKAIRQVTQSQLTDGTDKSKAKPKPTAKSSLGSSSYVNEDHPDYARMDAAGLINDEGSETPFVVSDGVPAQAVLPIKRKDGTIVIEAAASVEEIVRTNLAFIISSQRFLNAEERVQAIDQLISKLKSERDFLSPLPTTETASDDEASTAVQP